MHRLHDKLVKNLPNNTYRIFDSPFGRPIMFELQLNNVPLSVKHKSTCKVGDASLVTRII